MECLYGHRLADDVDLMSYVEGPRAEHLAWKPEMVDKLKATLAIRGSGVEAQLFCAVVSPRLDHFVLVGSVRLSELVAFGIVLLMALNYTLTLLA